MKKYSRTRAAAVSGEAGSTHSPALAGVEVVDSTSVFEEEDRARESKRWVGDSSVGRPRILLPTQVSIRRLAPQKIIVHEQCQRQPAMRS